MYLVTLSWRVIPHAVGRFCEIKDGDNADIPSMVYTKFRVNFWVLAILQSKTIVHKGENRLYELLKYWLSVWKDSITMCASLILIILHCVSIKIGFLMIKFLMNKDIIRLKFPSKTLLYNPMSSYVILWR